MEPALQRRMQRYGWDRAAPDYESSWHAQLAPAQSRLLDCAALGPGEDVLDVACGSGLVTRAVAQAIGPLGHAFGIDLSGAMVEAARRQAEARALSNARFARMDAEALDLEDASFDVVACALGLMYMPDPARALCEMHRVLRPGGRVALAIWGDRARCGWSALFDIVDDEVTSEVCPLFFRLGEGDALERACAAAGFEAMRSHRMAVTLEYDSGDDACRAAFAGGPVALAWSRFSDEARRRVRSRYLRAIAPWRRGAGYSVPGEFLVVCARAPGAMSARQAMAHP